MDLTSNSNLLFPLTSNVSFYSILALIALFILTFFWILYDLNFSLLKSKESVIQNTLFVLFSALLIFGACILFVPSFKYVKEFILQIQNVIYMVLYTIFVILFYVLTPSKWLKEYSAIINPSIFALGVLSFYLSSSTNFISSFNMSYERIKMMILFLCLFASFATFYSTTQKSNSISTMSVLLMVATIFAFLYTLVLVVMPSSDNSISSLPFTSFGVYGSLLFIAFLAIAAWFVYTKRDSLLKNTPKIAAVTILLLVISILWSILIGAHLFNKAGSANDVTTASQFKAALLIVFGLCISGMFIYWISAQLNQLSGSSSIVRFSLNVALVTIVLALLYKTISIQTPYQNNKKSAFVNLITSVFLYIPCMTSQLFDSITKTSPTDVNIFNRSNVAMLVVSSVLLVSYLYSYVFLNQLNNMGGNQLVNQPVPLNKEIILGNYKSLNNTDTSKYQYAISAWIYIEAVPPTTNINYTRFVPLLQYGNKPSVLYNATKNTLRIIMQQQDLKNHTTNKLIEFDNDDNRILYENKDVLLQKWNNLILNYNGGTLDIFWNGELVKSLVEVTPYVTYDNLSIGENQGILGGICNVVYFDHSIDHSKVYYLYNAVKSLNPPILNDSSETIIHPHFYNNIASNVNKIIKNKKLI